MFEEYNTKIIRYPDNSVEIIKYGKTRLRGSPELKNLNSSADHSETARKRRALEQSYRIKRKIKHIIRSNDFDLFWTLTFDDAKVNASDYSYARKRLSAWLKYQREKYSKFGYLFLPELHPTSGRIHFHGVTEKFSPPLVEARSPKTNRLIKKKGIQIYNAENWKNGFSTVSKVDDKSKVSNYIAKYITKELVEMPTAYNQPRYFVSRGLKRPEISYETFNEKQLQQFKPSFVVGDMSDKTMNFEADLSIYNLNISGEQFSQATSPETVYKLGTATKKNQIANQPPTAYIDNLKDVDI